MSLYDKFIKNNSIKANAIKIFIMQFLSLSFAFISSILIARFLGPEIKGIFDLFCLFVVFLSSFGTLGLQNGLVFQLANQKQDIVKINGIAISFSVVMWLITIIIGLSGLDVIEKFFPSTPRWAIITVLLSSFCVYYKAIWNKITIGLNKPVKEQMFLLINKLIHLAVVLYLILTNSLNIQNVIVLFISLFIVDGLISFIDIFSKYPKLLFDYKLFRKSFDFGMTTYLTAIVNSFHLHIDKLMLGIAMGTEAVGIYTVSTRFAELIFIADSAIAHSSMSKIASLDFKSSYKLTKQIIKNQVVVNLIVGTAIIAISYVAITYLYGKEYVDAFIPVLVLLPGVIFWSFGKMLSCMIGYNRNMPEYTRMVAVVVTIANVILNCIALFVLKSGIIGVAVSSTISYSLFTFLQYIKFVSLKDDVSSSAIEDKDSVKVKL